MSSSTLTSPAPLLCLSSGWPSRSFAGHRTPNLERRPRTLSRSSRLPRLVRHSVSPWRETCLSDGKGSSAPSGRLVRVLGCRLLARARTEAPLGQARTSDSEGQVDPRWRIPDGCRARGCGPQPRQPQPRALGSSGTVAPAPSHQPAKAKRSASCGALRNPSRRSFESPAENAPISVRARARASSAPASSPAA
jgi:hypothetical protein